MMCSSCDSTNHAHTQNAAMQLIPAASIGRVHQRISIFLRQPRYRDDFVYEAANHAMAAHQLGAPHDDHNQLTLLYLDAASRAALAASFEAAQRYLQRVQVIIDRNGGRTVWMRDHRQLYLRYIQQYSENCSMWKRYDAALEEVR